jgi:hypothetical protein
MSSVRKLEHAQRFTKQWTSKKNVGDSRPLLFDRVKLDSLTTAKRDNTLNSLRHRCSQVVARPPQW